MRRLSLFVGVAFATVLFLTSLNTKAYAIAEVEVRYWNAELALDAQVSKGASVGTVFDFVDALDMDNKEGIPELRAKVGFFGNNLRYAFTNLSWEGNDKITKNFTFDGDDYFIAMDAKSEFNLAYHRLGVEFGFELAENQLGIILELKYFDAEMNLSIPGQPDLKKSESAGLPVPAIGATFNVNLPFLISFGGEVTGFSAGSKLTVLDAEAALHFDPGPFMTFSLGYRMLEISADDGDDNTLEISVDGPFARLEVGF